MSSREKIEQAIKSRFGDLIDYRVCKNSDGEYMAWDMQVAWWAWQAAETSMAVQLANTESKCRELAAENEKRNTHSEALAVDNAALREVVERMVNQFAMSGISPEEKSINPAKSLMFDAKSALFMPATDAYLAEVRASSIPDEATERDLFEEWVMEKIFISKTTLEGLRTDDGYRNSTLSGTDYNGMWSQWKAIRAAQLRQEAAQ
ncbi:TPA: hypothetical protein ACQJIL_003052 [Citrobacter freundii]